MSNRQQNGFTLVELMVSVLISAFMLGSLIQILSSSKTVFRTQEASANLLENGRFAMNYLDTLLRQTGYEQFNGDLSNVVIGCEQGSTCQPVVSSIDLSCESNDILKSESGVGCPVLSSKACDDDTTNCIVSDILSVRYASISQTVAGKQEGYPTDCFGRFGREDSNFEVINHFFVAQTTEDDTALYCKSIIVGETATTGENRKIMTRPVIQGIEDLQVSYGMDLLLDPTITATNGRDYVPDRYATASQVGTNMNRVVALQIGMLAKSEKAVRSTVDKNQYEIANTVIAAPNDRYLRKAFNTTVMLRNRLDKD